MDVMEKAIFYVDFCYEAGSDEYGCNVSGRYQFGLELTDEEYEELYQIWYDQNELNSWSTEWDGHEPLYQKDKWSGCVCTRQISGAGESCI